MKKEKPYIVGGEYVSLEDYRKTKVDSYLLRFPKGKKEEIKAFAELQGDSLNSFINKAIDEKMERESPSD